MARTSKPRPDLDETVRLDILEPEAAPPGRRERLVPHVDLTRWRSRIAAYAIIALLPIVLAFVLPDFRILQITYAFIFAIVGISMNQLMGYLGQISLGHQAFLGVGSFTAANVVTSAGLSFWVALPIAAVTGAVAGAGLGVAALRLKGLYFALVTLAYGFMAENTIFQIPALTRGGAGMPAPRPPGFTSERNYFFLVLFFFTLLQFVDWRLVRSKTGRAIQAIRDDERVAAGNGINVSYYKLVAFGLSGAYAGVAGALFAHWREQVVAPDFSFTLAITFVLMTVVGGLGSRAGVFIGSCVFALLPLVFVKLTVWTPLIGAALLLGTLIFKPGGIGQQIRPFTDWLAGKPFRLKH